MPRDTHPEPAEARTGHACSLVLSIDGTRYKVRPGTTDDLPGDRPWIARPGWHLTRQDGTSYFVHARGDSVLSCNCSAFRFARRDTCKHLKAFQALGILPK